MVLQNFSTAGIAFNIILIRVGQNRSDVEESRLGRGSVIKGGQISMLQFNGPSATSQDHSLTSVEEDV